MKKKKNGCSKKLIIWAILGHGTGPRKIFSLLLFFHWCAGGYLNDSFFRPNIFESTALQISIPGKARFIACSVYRPNTHRELNDSNQIKAFFENLESFLETISDLSLPTVVGGDFNLNLFNINDTNSNTPLIRLLF